MNLPRAAFLSHFVPVFRSTASSSGRSAPRRRQKRFHVACMNGSGLPTGQMTVDLQAFREVVWPVIERLHRKTSGARPEPDELTGSAMSDAPARRAWTFRSVPRGTAERKKPATRGNALAGLKA